MINISELRIGNYINFAEENTVCKVKGIDSDGLGITVYFLKSKEETWIEVTQFQSIPITPEILVNNCRFVKRDNRYVFQPELLNVEYRLIDFHVWVFSIGFFNWNNEITNISYVHELQNLYFAIAHEELQINNL
jgi:hypothetical protein